MDVTYRAVRRDEIAAFRAAILRVFGMDWPASDDEDERYVSLLPPERTLAAFDGSSIVGTSGTFGVEMSIPGSSIPVAALTMVTVAHTHRRRGILRTMMQHHVESAESRGDLLSVLWASEAAIYGRFGYGIAAEHDAATVEARGLDIPLGHGADALRMVDGPERELVCEVYESARRQRAGMLGRSATWWSERHFRDPEFRRRGASARRYVVAERGDAITGYLAYRQRPKMEGGIADGEVQVDELIALDAQSAATLWRHATRIDLHPRLSVWSLPVDGELPWLVDDRRKVRTVRADAVWVRICDVPGAMTARTYDHDGRVTFCVVDPMHRVDGTYALEVQEGRASCRRVDAPAEVELGLNVLGTLYLGGFRAWSLAHAGALRAPHDVIARLDRLFATRRAPWCAEIF